MFIWFRAENLDQSFTSRKQFQTKFLYFYFSTFHTQLDISQKDIALFVCKVATIANILFFFCLTRSSARVASVWNSL